MTVRPLVTSLALAVAFVATGAAAADLKVTQTGGGAGQSGQTRTFVATASSVTLAVPPGLAITVTGALQNLSQITANGTGWACTVTGQAVSCTRSDGVPAGSPLPPITLTAVVGLGSSYSSCVQVAHDINAAVQPDQVAANNTACANGPIVRTRPDRR